MVDVAPIEQNLDVQNLNEKQDNLIVSSISRELDTYIDSQIMKKDGKDIDFLKRINRTREYFYTKIEGETDTPIERIAQIFSTLNKPENPEELVRFEEAIKNYSAEIIKRAFDQHIENPEKYVSHGFDHSLRVVNYVSQILESSPEIIEAMVKEHGISKDEAVFLMQIAALSHDFGYVLLAENNNKVAHSVTGVRIIGDKNSQVWLRKLLSCSEEQKNKLIYDLEGAILFHNSDILEAHYDAKVETIRGEFLSLTNKEKIAEVIFYYDGLRKSDPIFSWLDLRDIVIKVKDEKTKIEIESYIKDAFNDRGYDPSETPTVIWINQEGSTALDDKLLFPGRKTDLYPGDKSIGIDYKKADTLDYSLLAVLRIADTMDMLPNRLSRVQRNPIFIKICERLYLEGASGSSQQGQLIIEKILHEDPSIEKEDLDGIKKISNSLTEESFKHFGGIIPLRSVYFELGGINHDEPQIVIKVDSKEYSRLKAYKFKSNVNDDGNIKDMDVSIAEYQIFRLYDTLGENFYAGKRISIKVIDEENNLIPFP